MQMTSDKKTITTITEYLNDIKKYTDGYSSDGSHYFFRGQAKTYVDDFAPTINRINKKKEHDIYYEVLTACVDDFGKNLTYGEILAKMQHYGVPTRLLDVTSNPLVALYFACHNHKSEDGKVYVIYPKDRHIKTFESDAVAILSSLPRINYDDYEKVYEAAMYYITEAKDNIKALKEFNDNFSVQRLLHEIKKEKPDFDRLYDPHALFNDLIYIPKQNNPRIVRQYGAFVLFSMSDLAPFESNDSSDPGLPFNTITISAKHKDELLSELEMLGISQSTLFPELYTVAESIKNNPKYKKT